MNADSISSEYTEAGSKEVILKEMMTGLSTECSLQRKTHASFICSGNCAGLKIVKMPVNPNWLLT